MKKLGILAGLAALGVAAVVSAQTILVPQVTAIGPNDLFQDVVGGNPQAQSFYAPATLLGNYGATLAGNGYENSFIGGDFEQNLFQDGTSVGTITTTATYVADGWFAFSGTSTTLGGAQETAAADIPTAYGASLRITRSGAGILQSCVAQILTTADTFKLQGQTVEVDFHALAGSGFSAANNTLTIYQVTSTGTNDTAANFAKVINSALSGTAWAGNATLSANVTLSGAAWQRYGAAFPVASTTTQVGYALCWTPVGTSPSSDYFEFTGAQLTRNSALTAVAGTAGAALNVNDARAKAFARRLLADEQRTEYAYYWRVNETATVRPFLGQVLTTSTANVKVQFPTPMWKAPAATYTSGGYSVTIAAGTSGANQVCTLTTVASTITAYGGTILCTATSGILAGNATELIGTLTTGSIIYSARL